MNARNDRLLDRLTRPAVVVPVLLGASALLSWAFADRNLPPPDEGAYLTAAARILDGAVYYRDIDAYPFPGASYLLAFAMALFGEHLSVARALAGAVFCTMVLASYAAALALLDRPRAALFGLSLLAWKLLAFPMSTMFFYADLAIAAGIVALALFLRHPYRGASPGLVGVGLAAGVALVCKQNVGIYVGGVAGLLILWPGIAGLPPRARPADRWRELVALGAGAAIPVGAMSLYFAAHGLFGQMIESGLLRPFTGYLPTSGVSFLPPLRWWELGRWDPGTAAPYLPQAFAQLLGEKLLPGEAWQPLWAVAFEAFSRVVYTALGVAVAAWAWLRLRLLRERGPADAALGERRGRLFAAAALAGAITLSAFPRADTSHVVPVYPVVLLMLFALARRRDLALGGAAPRPLRPPRWTAVAVGLWLTIMAALALRYDRLYDLRLRLDRADVRARTQDAWVGSLVPYVRETIPPGEPFFVYGHEAQLYFLTDRYSPWPFSQIYPGMAGGDDGRSLSEMILRERPELIAQGIQRWPAMPTIPDYTRVLQRTIRREYVPDREVFRGHPVVDGPEPPGWLFQLWRLRGRSP